MRPLPHPSFRAHFRPTGHPVRSRVARRLAAGAAAGALAATTVPMVAPAHAANPVTPGSLTGYGFDQCEAPESWKMDRWMSDSPFLAVGIYISGDSRGCREQRNLSPWWVSHQLQRGWRLLPITLGPQASCHPDFPRYDDDETIDPSPGPRGFYSRAKDQGLAEGSTSVRAARRLGIAKGSTLWYDLEGFDSTDRHCRESALKFVSGWVQRVHSLGYQTGVYSSAASGIKMLDNARINKRRVSLPGYLWIARWDGIPNTSTTYIGEEGWNPHRRVKQYQGGHDETWAGVTINIDRNWLDVGRGTRPPRVIRHCGGVTLDFAVYPTFTRGGDNPARKVKALQCLLKEKGFYDEVVSGRYDWRTVRAVKAWQRRRLGADRPGATWKPYHWVTLLSAGRTPPVKVGSSSDAVRRIQRALNASFEADLRISGAFDRATERALATYQRRAGYRASGVANDGTWRELQD